MSDTKDVVFQNMIFRVPSWVNYVAADKDGCRFGYEQEPYLSDGEWQVSSGCVCQITTDTPWSDSLEKV